MGSLLRKRVKITLSFSRPHPQVPRQQDQHFRAGVQTEIEASTVADRIPVYPTVTIQYPQTAVTQT